MYFILHTVRSFTRRYKTRNTVDLTSALNADASANDAPYTQALQNWVVESEQQWYIVSRELYSLFGCFLFCFFCRFCFL